MSSNSSIDSRPRFVAARAPGPPPPTRHRRRAAVPRVVAVILCSSRRRLSKGDARSADGAFSGRGVLLAFSLRQVPTVCLYGACSMARSPEIWRLPRRRGTRTTRLRRGPAARLHGAHESA